MNIYTIGRIKQFLLNLNSEFIELVNYINRHPHDLGIVYGIEHATLRAKIESICDHKKMVELILDNELLTKRCKIFLRRLQKSFFRDLHLLRPCEAFGNNGYDFSDFRKSTVETITRMEAFIKYLDGKIKELEDIKP